MARRNRRPAEIDITPLIDVLFMLIIFFVLTASFAQGRLEVQLPSGEGRSGGMEGAVLLTVDRRGKIYWRDRLVTREELRALASESKEREVLVAGDKDVPYGAVAEVLSILRGRGVSNAGLMLSGERVR